MGVTEPSGNSSDGTPEATLLPATVIAATRRRLRAWGRKNYRDFPWRKPDRMWHALVAEVFLQRTRARNVLPVYISFVTRFPTTDALQGISEEEVGRIMYPLGLRWRAPLLKKLLDHLITTGGYVPDTYEKLLELPGVGPYVAAAMVSFHHGKRSIIIDANVVRWLCRMVDRPMDGETRRDRWLIELAEAITPARKVGQFNYALLDFTMEICATKPQCDRCPLGARLCAYGRHVMEQNPSPTNHVPAIDRISKEAGSDRVPQVEGTHIESSGI